MAEMVGIRIGVCEAKIKEIINFINWKGIIWLLYKLWKLYGNYFEKIEILV